MIIWIWIAHQITKWRSEGDRWVLLLRHGMHAWDAPHLNPVEECSDETGFERFRKAVGIWRLVCWARKEGRQEKASGAIVCYVTDAVRCFIFVIEPPRCPWSCTFYTFFLLV